MRFASINMLWLIWAVPVVLLVCLWGFRKRKRILSGYASDRALSAISPGSSALRRWLKAGILLTVLLLMAISLAGPQYGYSWKKIHRRGVDLVVALDCSRSMLAQDIKPSRLERAKREILDLLGMLHGDRVGLVAFAGTAFLQCPLTMDYSGFNLFLNALTPDYLPVGGTNLAAAITTSMSAFNMKAATDKAIILITDGGSTSADPLAAARKAAAAGIKVFCIGVGAKDGAPIPAKGGGFIKDRNGNIVLSKLDDTVLKKIAAVTSGAYVRSVSGDMDLNVLYTKYIRGTMTRAELGEQKVKVFENRYQWLLALALALLVLELALPVKKSSAVWVLMILTAAMARPADASVLKKAVNQATAAYAAGHYDKAAQHYVTAQLEAPQKPQIAYDLGNARYKAGDYDDALQAYSQVLASKDAPLKEKARYNMGNAYFKKGNLDKAIENYQAALRMDAKDTEARENLEYVKKLKAHRPKTSQNKNHQENQKNKKDQKNRNNRGTNEQKANRGKSGQGRQQQNSGQKQSGKNHRAGQGKNQPTPAPQEAGQKKSPATQRASSQNNAQSKAAPNAEAAREAENMLNSLQDQPGRAMIPTYGKRPVEKDW